MLTLLASLWMAKPCRAVGSLPAPELSLLVACGSLAGEPVAAPRKLSAAGAGTSGFLVLKLWPKGAGRWALAKVLAKALGKRLA
ncbi:MAG: hypothetical protein NZ899_15350, partial [Thermoguttaceae bacterium]|nr:hypothetical protein [Thermoguttaceae bacterium]